MQEATISLWFSQTRHVYSLSTFVSITEHSVIVYNFFITNSDDHIHRLTSSVTVVTKQLRRKDTGIRMIHVPKDHVRHYLSHPNRKHT
jgi:hypothetical protein